MTAVTATTDATAAAATAGGFLPFVSALFGWVYFICWSLSFYPQPWLNYRRKSTSGTTVDFPFVNCLGFAAYFCQNAAFYCSPLVRSQYAARHRGLTPTVALNDLVFALHGLALSLVTTSQYLVLRRRLWGLDPRATVAGTRPSLAMLGISAGCCLGVAGTYLVVAFSSPSGGAGTMDPAVDWCALDVVYAVGYVKVVVTLTKYTPQVLANYRNKSTRGWSIWQILLDLAGGVLSIAQQALDSYLQRDWSGVTGNPVKFILGNVSMAYDAVFVAQHYVIYRGAGDAAADADAGADARETDGLLGDEERRID